MIEPTTAPPEPAGPRPSVVALDRLDHRDRIVARVTSSVSSPPVRVWEVLTRDTASWWADPYLAPGRVMRMEARLGGSVWAAVASDGEGAYREHHGTIRHIEAPAMLVVGGVLVPGAFSGSIRFRLTHGTIGTEVEVEQEALGVSDDHLESELVLGWTRLLARLGDLAEH